ncbi:MAG: hypothetical protein CVU46_10555 [Chloroflexi bacterium HGW-Chloroflexi-8]|nr:MAG: hypothetical protein CVU46_10555 [Chloroflexi bacterium HGW-Chloroflexi-8]
MKIPLNQIKPNPQQPRKTFDQASIEELAQSIIQVGLIQPVVVTPNGKGYYLVDGERRWRAAQLIPGMLEIEAVVSDQAGTDQERMVQSLVANIQREDLSLVEEAKAYGKMNKEFGIPMVRIALLTGHCLATIKTRMLILDLDPEIQALMDDSSMPHDDEVIKAIQSLPDSVRVKFAQKMAKHGLSISGIKKAVEKVNKHLQTDPESECEIDFDTPSIKFAVQKNKYTHKRNWGALQQLNKLPPWEELVTAANKTCDACSLSYSASPVVCRECPAVELISKLLEIAQ